MKPRQQSNVRRTSSLLAVSFAMSLSAAHATALTWDGSDTLTSGAQGGAGTWNMNSTANWWDGAADVVWPNTGTDNDAIFANTAGTVTLAGVTANDLTFSTTGYLIQSNTLTLNGTTPTITTDPGVSATISSVVSGAAGLVKSGSGTLTLSGINNYSGGTSVNAGKLTLDLSARSGGMDVGTFAIGASGTLEIADGTNTNVDNKGFEQNSVFTGTGTITKTGIGYFGLFVNVGFRDFAGLIDIQQGVLGNNSSGWGSGAGAMDLNIAAGAALDMRTQNINIDALSGAGTIEKTHTPALTLSLGNNNGSATFSGVISQTIGGGSGTIALTKNGSGTQTLSGTMTYSGATTVNAGALELLKPVSFTSDIVMGAANSPTLQLSSTLVADSWTLTQQISGGSANAKIEKTGLGTVILTPSAGSSFVGTSTGALTVSGGKLYLNGAFSTAPAVSVAAGALFGGTATAGNVTVGNTGILEGGMSGSGTLTAANVTLGSLATDTATLKGALSATVGYKALAVTNLTLNGGDNTVTLDAAGTGLTNATYYDLLVSTNAISAPNATGGLAVNVFKSNSRAYTPNVDVTLKKVQLYYDAAATVYWTGATSSAWNPTATNWKLSGNNAATEFLANDVVFFHDSPISSTVDISNGNVSPISTTFDSTIATAYTLQGSNGIAAGSLNKSGSGTLTITNANSFGGGTTLSGGTLNLEQSAALGSGTVTINGGTLNLNNAATLGSGTLSLNGGTLNLNNTATLGSSPLVLAGGTLNINHTATLGSGTHTLNSGTLNLSHAAALGSGTLVINGGTLDNTSAAAITLTTNNAQTWGGNLVFTGTKDLNLGTGAVAMTASRDVSVTAGTLTVGGAISGTGPLTKSGTGTLTLSGINSYSGGTSVTAGTLTLDLSARSGGMDVGTFAIGASGTLEVAGGTNTGVDNKGFEQNSVFTGTGTITKTGIGYFGLFVPVGFKDFAGLIDIQQGVLGNNSAGWGSGPGAMDLNIATGAFLDMRTQNINIDALSGTGTIEKTHTPALTLSLGNNNGSATFSGVISQTIGGGSGTIALIKNGSGTQTLSGTMTYTGATTINAGTLELLKPISFASNIAMGTANSPTLQLSSTLLTDSWTLAQQISGGSANAKLEKTGLGTVVLTPSAGSTFVGTSSGALTVTGGKLYLNAAFTTAPAVSVAAGALFGGSATVANVTVTNTGTLEGGMGGSGTLTAANVTIGSLATDTATLKGTLSATSGYKPLAVTNLTLNGGDNTVTLDAAGTGLSSGSYYDLLVSTNAISAPNASGGLAVNVFKSNSRAYTPNVDVTGTKVQLYYDAAASVYWTGAASSAWNPTATNWKLSGNNLATEFLANDVVFFHDSPASSTVDISNGNVNPISTTFDNSSATAYTLQGSNGIATGSLNKSGGGILTITNANSYGGGTTLGGGTLNLEHAAALGSGSVTINGGTLNLNNTAVLGAGALVIAGGTLNINNASTLGSGSLALNGGALNLSTAAALGSRTLALNGGTLDNTSAAAITLTTNNTQTWGGSMVFTGSKDLNLGTGAVSLTASHTLSVTAGTLTVGGAISGSGPLTKSGAGTLILSGINNYSGGTNVTDGTLKLDLSARLNGIQVGTFALGASANLEVRSSSNAAVDSSGLDGNSKFTGTGTFTKTGTGYIGLFFDGSASNEGVKNFAGLIDIQEGVLGNNSPGWGSGPGLMDLNIAAGAMLDMRTQNVKIDALSGAGTIEKTYVPNLNLSLGNNDGSATFSGVIDQTVGGGAGNISLTKNGSGTQTLSGANNYGGGTTINTGTLLVNNTTGSGTGSGAVTVSGGILGGTGSIAGTVTLNGGTLAPGASIESLTTGALTMNTGTTFAYEMNSTTGAYAADLLVVTGNVALNGTVQLGLTDVLGGAATRFAGGTILTLINYAGVLNGGFFYGTALDEGDTFIAGLNTWKINYVAATGGLNFTGVLNPGSHFINLTAIPEPGSLLALGCLVGSGMLLRSRRRH